MVFNSNKLNNLKLPLLSNYQLFNSTSKSLIYLKNLKVIEMRSWFFSPDQKIKFLNLCIESS